MERTEGKPKKIKPKFLEVYNEGIKPITIFKNRNKHDVIHPKKSQSLVTLLAEKLMEENKDLILYEDFLKKQKESKKDK